MPKIVLTITNRSGKNILFVSKDIEPYLLKKAILLAQKGQLENVGVVRSGRGIYLRSHPDSTRKNNLDSASITASRLLRGFFNYSLVLSHPALKVYESIRQARIGSVATISIDGIPRKTKKQVVEYISKHQNLINTAALRQNIDRYLLGAILIDEYVRRGPEDWLDWLALLGKDTSVGLAQIKVSTARDIIKLGYYNPAPAAKGTSTQQLYRYLNTPKHSVHFAAAVIRWRIDEWMPFIDLSERPDIIGVLFSHPTKPHEDPKSTPRSLKIQKEFYPLAKTTLGR